MEGMTNTLLPAKYSILLPLFLWKRVLKRAKAKSKYHFSVVFTAGNWKLYIVNEMERNTAGDGVFILRLNRNYYLNACLNFGV